LWTAAAVATYLRRFLVLVTVENSAGRGGKLHYTPRMLAPCQIIFTAVDEIADHASGNAWDAAAEALQALARRGVPLVLSTRGTRAQLEPLRRKLQHGHPFLTESAAGLFIPDGYFNLRLEGATRFGRNFCVPFGRTHAEAAAALPEIAEEAGASVVGFSQISLREIARNSGLSTRDAELYRQREFGEIFFFAGETEKTTRRFSQLAREKGWEAVPGDPLWDFRGPLKHNGENAVRYLMRMYRKALHGRQRSIGIGSGAADLHLLSATDTAVILPRRPGEFDDVLLSRLPRAKRAEQAGPAGWGEAIMQVLEKP
jgi:mannosyl-3-phosphoglycerate phosphatase